MTSITNEKLIRARTAMIIERPFFGALALRLKLEEAPWLDHDMAVDGKTLYFNRDRVNALPMDEVKVTLIHEVIHCALGHPWRRGGREIERWNQACDYAANLLVRDSGETLWEGALINDAFKDDPAERIYTKLAPPKQDPAPGKDKPDQEPDEDEDEGGQDEGEGGQDQGEDQVDDPDTGGGEDGQDGSDGGDSDGEGQAGDAPAKNQTPDGRPLPSGQGGAGRGAVIDAPPDADGHAPTEAEHQEQEQEWKLAVAQAAQMAAAAGNLPGCFKSFVKDVLSPKAPWQQLLREFMRNPCKDDYSWSRPNRRHIGNGLYLPSAHSERLGTFALFIDTSGSVSDDMLSAFIAEINGILDEIKPELTIVIPCDAVVHEEGIRFYMSDDYPVEYEALGRGGTRFQPAFDWVEQNLDEPPVCAAYFTDMAPCDDPQDPGYPVLWMDYAGGYAPDLPFGERVVVE